MRRVVVTGLGIVSSIGTNAEAVTASLKAGRSGITANAEMAEHGFPQPDRGRGRSRPGRAYRQAHAAFHGAGGGLYSYIAMGQAIADAGLAEDEVVNPMTGLIAGSGGPSTSAMLAAHQTVLNTGGTKRIGPFAVPKCMSSTVSANLATAYRIKRMNFSITSACLHLAALYRHGGTADRTRPSRTSCSPAAGRSSTGHFPASSTRWGAMSSKFNDTPARASPRLRRRA